MNASSLRSFAAATLALLATYALPAAADDAPGCQRPQVTTKEAEGTADGGITAAKHAAAASKRFEMMDANKDGKISAAEWQASGERRFARLDRNKDGVITVEELGRGAPRGDRKR